MAKVVAQAALVKQHYETRNQSNMAHKQQEINHSDGGLLQSMDLLQDINRVESVFLLLAESFNPVSTSHQSPTSQTLRRSVWQASLSRPLSSV